MVSTSSIFLPGPTQTELRLGKNQVKKLNVMFSNNSDTPMESFSHQEPALQADSQLQHPVLETTVPPHTFGFNLQKVSVLFDNYI